MEFASANEANIADFDRREKIPGAWFPQCVPVCRVLDSKLMAENVVVSHRRTDFSVTEGDVERERLGAKYAKTCQRNNGRDLGKYLKMDKRRRVGVADPYFYNTTNVMLVLVRKSSFFRGGPVVGRSGRSIHTTTFIWFPCLLNQNHQNLRQGKWHSLLQAQTFPFMNSEAGTHLDHVMSSVANPRRFMSPPSTRFRPPSFLAPDPFLPHN